MTFKKGDDPKRNLSGRPKGAKSKVRLIDEALSNYSTQHNVNAKQAIIDSLIGQAIEGDTQSAKIILERLTPALKPVNAPIAIDVRLPRDPVKRAEKLIELTLKGELLPDEAKLLLEGMKSVMQIKEFEEIEKRIEELENAQTKQ